MINADGSIIVAHGFASLSHAVTGIYQFTLINPPAILANILTLATLILDVNPGEIGTAVSPGIIGTFIEVFTNDVGGNPTNRSFSLVVYDLS